MVRRAVEASSGAPQPAGPYSHGVESNGFFYTAGFGPQDPVTGEVPVTVAEQTERVLRSIQAVLEARGLNMDDVVKATVHLADLADFQEFNVAYEAFFSEPYPVRTTVGSQLPNIRVEIDVVAQISQD